MVFGGKTGVLHARRLCRRRPLVGVEIGGIKGFDRSGRVTPFPVLESRHIKVDEHAKPKVDKSLLNVEEGLVRVVWRHGLALGEFERRQGCARGKSGDGLAKISPGRHGKKHLHCASMKGILKLDELRISGIKSQSWFLGRCR